LQQDDQILYSLLKKEIAAAMKKSFPGIDPEISEWKGQTITDFQEDLLMKVNGRISEKWFYTHMKSDERKLPRIDVLNMVSQYAGYKNWDDFRHRNGSPRNIAETISKSNRVFILIPLLVLSVMVVLYAIYSIVNTQTYHLTFIDSETGDVILNNTIQADLILKDESPFAYVSDKYGRIIIRTDQSKIKLAVSAPGYVSDTITRILRKFNRSETIRLKSDPYSMMIEYFSQTNVRAWQERRRQLDKIFSDNAIICQVADRNNGSLMEMYNKWEFIDKLTMPASSLRHIAVLNSRYEKNQIVILRFKNNSDRK
jgi:hypothetical protein